MVSLRIARDERAEARSIRAHERARAQQRPARDGCSTVCTGYRPCIRRPRTLPARCRRSQGWDRRRSDAAIGPAAGPVTGSVAGSSSVAVGKGGRTTETTSRRRWEPRRLQRSSMQRALGGHGVARSQPQLARESGARAQARLWTVSRLTVRWVPSARDGAGVTHVQRWAARGRPRNPVYTSGARGRDRSRTRERPFEEHEAGIGAGTRAQP
jgi:hypothetical protein